MKLRRPCEHDRYESHPVILRNRRYPSCPGGEFLAESALVIEPCHEEEVALAILKDAGVLRRRVEGDRQMWQTQWEWSDEYMKQKAAP